MLILKPNDKMEVAIGEEIIVRWFRSDVDRKWRIGIEAPKDIPIKRQERTDTDGPRTVAE